MLGLLLALAGLGGVVLWPDPTPSAGEAETPRPPAPAPPPPEPVAKAQGLAGRGDGTPPPPKVAPPKPAPRRAPASERFVAPTAKVPVDQRWQASVDFLRGVRNPRDVEALRRHLRRFLPPSRRWNAGGTGGRMWADALVDRVGTDRDRVTDVEVLPAADVEASEARRLEQLENLRQRDAVGLLDAIHAGLAWLALHQAADGSFSEADAAARCAELKHSPACVRRGLEKDVRGEVAATALAVMAFLDFRDQDAVGLFEPYLAKAAQWLVRTQRPDGSFPGGGQLYTSAIGLMALGHAAASTGDPALRAAVARGLARFDENPGLGGGFRYAWGNDADLSVTAWVAQAVEAARAAGVDVPRRMETNLRWFLDVVRGEGAAFRYRTGSGFSPSLAPAGMLMGRILWDPLPEETAAAWNAWLDKPPWRAAPPLYTLYYGARMGILLQGGLRDPWRKWSFDLAAAQVRDGANAGAFRCDADRWFQSFGNSVMTPFAVLTLEHALYLR